MKVIIDGFKSEKHAEMFIKWYEGGGEQAYGDHVQCIYENEEERNMDAYINCLKTYPLKLTDDAYTAYIR